MSKLPHAVVVGLTVGVGVSPCSDGGLVGVAVGGSEGGATTMLISTAPLTHLQPQFRTQHRNASPDQQHACRRTSRRI